MKRRVVLGTLGVVFTPGCIFSSHSTNGPSPTPTTDESSPTPTEVQNHPTDTSTTDSGGSSITPNGMIRPETDPERSPAARTCPDESSTRLSSLQGSVEWGNADSLALRVSDLSIEFGEAVEISLLNVSNDTVVTGNEYMYNIDQYTDAGWRETRVTIDGTPEPYTDEGVIHQPGEGYQWVIHFREDGTISAPVHDHSLTVCPTLEAGRYRFVYWGALESSLAVAFDVR